MIIRSLSFFLTVCAFILATSPACFASGQSNSTCYDDMLLKQNTSDQKFSSEEWKRSGNHRKAMLYDLVHSSALIGMSGAEIYSLLGQPLWENENSVFYSLGDNYRKEVFVLCFKDTVVNKYAAGFHICRGISCAHLSRWYFEPLTIRSEDTSLDTSAWHNCLTGGWISLPSGIALFEDCFSKNSNTPFESKVWKNASERSRRYRMLYDFLHSHKLIGMRRESVIELFGKPTITTVPVVTRKPIEQNMSELDSIDRYLILSLSSGCIAGPLLFLELGYDNDAVTSLRTVLDAGSNPPSSCWEIMGNWQTANLSVSANGASNSITKKSRLWESRGLNRTGQPSAED
jgi:hypothetical protein